MHSDQTNQYRVMLDDDPPSFIDRVDTPWDEVPDYADYNATAYRHIVRDLNRLRRAALDGKPTSRGVLVLGESGTGKTHLLMRVAKKLAKANHISFVRRPNDEESVAQHVWTNILSSLARELPASGEPRSQLDDLLFHVFSNVLIPEFEQDVQDGRDAAKKRRWVELLKEDPYNLSEMLGEGENRSANLRNIRSRTLRYLQRARPEADQQIVHALMNYCFVSNETRRRIVLTWLSGQDIDERESQAMGLPTSWVAQDDDSSDVSIQQRREERALRAIQTIGILSIYYQPLILAFDQLEGLRNEEGLTRRWGDVVREVFTMAPNFLIVTCTFPSLWQSWFQPQLDSSASQRIAAQQVVLEPFKSEHGLRLLEKQMEDVFTRHGLPTSIYPFTQEDAVRLCSQATSPRLFIQQAHTAFNAWLDRLPQPCTPTIPSRSAPQTDVERLLREAIAKFESEQRRMYDTDITTEQDLFGRIRCLVRAILGPSTEYDKADCGHYVLPLNLVVRSRGDSLCIAVLNRDGRAFTSRIRNLTDVLHDGDQFSHALVLRDCRCNQITENGQECLKKLQRYKGTCLLLGIDDYAFVNALYDTIVAIEERNLSIGARPITKEQFAEFMKSSGIARRSQLFRTVARMAACFEPLLQPPADATDRSQPVTSPAPAQPEPLALGDVPEDDTGFEDVVEEGWDGLSAEFDESVGEATKTTGTAVLAPSVSKVTETVTVKQTTGNVSDPHVTITVPKCDAIIGDTELDSIHVGVLGTLRDNDQTLGISLTKPQCIVLLGYMGSGKSYALGVLIENATLPSSPLIRSTRPMSVVAFNYRKNPEARFEYWGYACPNDQEAEVQALASKYGAAPTKIDSVNVFGYSPELKRRQADYHGLPTYPIQFRPEELGAENWAILMKAPGRQSEYMDVIRAIIQDLYYADRLTSRNLERSILADERLSESQRRLAKNRLSFAARWLTDDRPYEWKDVLKEGVLNVFDLRVQTLNGDEALKLCLVITDLVRRTRNGVNKMVVFDEAHEYVDSKELINELENAITQIRHDGLSFVVASQFPERIPESIFKYLLTRIIFKLPTNKAITYLQKVAPNLKKLSMGQVANLGLEQGLCFIQTDDDRTDPSLAIPQLLEVRPRCSLHGGATKRHI